MRPKERRNSGQNDLFRVRLDQIVDMVWPSSVPKALDAIVDVVLAHKSKDKTKGAKKRKKRAKHALKVAETQSEIGDGK